MSQLVNESISVGLIYLVYLVDLKNLNISESKGDYVLYTLS